MNDLVENIKFDFLKNLSDKNTFTYINSIYFDFGSEEKFFFRDEIIDIFNTYHLPFFQNFDRLND